MFGYKNVAKVARLHCGMANPHKWHEDIQL